MRTGLEARAWAMKQITTTERAPTRSGTWEGMCQMFVRMCFDSEGGFANAGAQWDGANARVRTSDPMAIPAFVPVHWELPTVEDHTAFSIGRGLCISTDAKRVGKPDIVSIDSITRGWKGVLLGWTKDVNGNTIWTPSPPPKPAPEPTRVRLARIEVWDAIGLLDDAAEDGRGAKVDEFRDTLRQALRDAPKS